MERTCRRHGSPYTKTLSERIFDGHNRRALQDYPQRLGQLLAVAGTDEEPYEGIPIRNEESLALEDAVYLMRELGKDWKPFRLLMDVCLEKFEANSGSFSY
jgi:hypothetical protein